MKRRCCFLTVSFMFVCSLLLAGCSCYVKYEECFYSIHEEVVLISEFGVLRNSNNNDLGVGVISFKVGDILYGIGHYSNLPEDSISIQENTLEKRLEEILKKMSGIDDVKVLITYSETNQIVPLYNEQEKETVTSDGQKTERDASKEVVFEENGSTKTPVLQTTKLPKMEGAIITAKGAQDIEVKANIIQAVEAATGLSSNKIQVFEMK